MIKNDHFVVYLGLFGSKSLSAQCFFFLSPSLLLTYVHVQVTQEDSIMISKFSIKKIKLISLQVSKGWALEVFHFPLLEWYLRVVGKKKTFWTLLHKLQYRMWTPVFAHNSTPVLSFVRWKWHFVHSTDLNGSPISAPQSLVPFIAYDYWYHPHLQYTGSLKAPPRTNFHWALLLWQFWSDIYTATFYTTRSVCLANFKV